MTLLANLDSNGLKFNMIICQNIAKNAAQGHDEDTCWTIHPELYEYKKDEEETQKAKACEKNEPKEPKKEENG